MMKRVLVFLPALALLSALLPIPSRADDADPAKLLIKHAVFTGWQLGDGKVRTLYSTRTATGKDGKVEFSNTELRSGMVYRRDFAYPDGSGDGNGFTGNLFWSSHENGFLTPIPGDQTKYRLAMDALLAEGTPQLPATLSGTGTIGGKSYPIVNVTMEGADAMNLYIDPATGAYARVVIDPGGDDETTVDNIQYVTVGGKKFLSSYFIDNTTYVNAGFKPNAQIGAADLHPPTPSATWTFANDKPFKLRVTTDRIYVDATINGVSGRFIFDTGSDGILLTRRFAGKINAKPFKHAFAIGIGGEGATKTDLYKVDSVVVGGNTLSNVIVSANSAEFHDGDEDPDGLIGYPLLGGAVVEVNTSNQTMTIHDPSTSIDGFPGITVNADLSNGTPVVPMRMNDKVDVNATLDSGSPFHVLFPKTLISQYNLKFLIDNSALASNMEMGGVSGTEIDQCGNIESLALGPIVYSPAPGCTSNSFSGKDVLVGFDFLRNFDFVFDYPLGKLLMAPHKQ